MTCCRKGAGIALVAVPVILMVIALLRSDWSSTETHLILQDKQARVNEDAITVIMGPFSTTQQMYQGDTALLSETSYGWCAGTASVFTTAEQSLMCTLLTTVRVAGFLSVGLGAILFFLYIVLITWSAKLPRFATTAKVAGALHLIQTIAAAAAVIVWWDLSYTYMRSLIKHLPVFEGVVLPLNVGWYYALAATVLSLVCTIVLFVVSKRGVAAREKDQEIQRKIRDFKAKQQAEELKLEMAL